MSVVTESARGACVLGGINDVLSAIHRFAPIYHSGPGCCMQTCAGEHNNSGFLNSVSLPSSNMLEKEVVFGGEKKLRSTIEGAVEIIDADAYFVLTGCTAGIIGDDVQSVVSDFRDKGVKIYAIDTPGFAGDSLFGYEAAFKALLDNIVEAGLPKKKGLVNLFGIIPFHDPYWFGNLEELTRILERLGLTVNTFFTRRQGLENVRTSSAAELNIIVNPYLLKKASEIYEKKFGVPSLRIPGLPIGATDTTIFIRKVGEALNLDQELIDQVIADEEDRVYSILERTGQSLGNNSFAVVGDPNFAIGATRFLANDYSQSPEIVVITEPQYRPEDRERIVKQLTTLEYARSPEVVFESDYFKLTQALDRHPEVDMLIGSSLEREYASAHDIHCAVATFPIFDKTILNKGYAGYNGGLSLVEDVFNFN